MSSTPPIQLEPFQQRVPAQPSRTRPLGVTLIALLFLWIGCFGTLVFPFVLLGPGSVTTLGPSLLSSVIRSHTLALFLSSLIALIWYAAYVAYVFIGVGLWRLRNWSRKAVIGISIFCVVAGVALVPLLWKVPAFILPALVGMVAPCGWTIWYLRRTAVRFAFGALPVLPTISGPPPPPANHRKLKVAIGIAATFALFIGGLFYAVESMFRSSDAYKLALADAQSSPCVAATIGTPIKSGWKTSGHMEESSEGGVAEISIPIQGTKGHGDLEVSAEKRGGSWNIKSLVLIHEEAENQITPGLAENCK